jgi:aspartyl-tRNA(Asn)/glutamyl-tRNA(Gln) amidotransferase subunit A
MTTRREFLAATATLSAMTSTAFAVADVESDPTSLSLLAAARMLRKRQLTSVALTRAYLERIDRLNPVLNAYITVTPELALQQAAAADAELQRGIWRGPLHGMPIALKDNIDTARIRTTAASAVHADRIPAQDAVCYQRLQAAGAVLLGKLNLHEFAYGGTSAISHFGPVRNPWNTEHIPGGSSGGSAAAVSARMCAAALGTDTLASIRQPAAYCGVAGFKPTHGLASIRGIIPISEALDHVGPLCRHVADAAVVMQALAGHDPLDPVSRPNRAGDLSEGLGRSTRGLRVGVVRDPFFADLNPAVDSAVWEAVDAMQPLTASVAEIDLPPAPSFVPLLSESGIHHDALLADPANHDLYAPLTLQRLQAAAATTLAEYREGLRALHVARATVQEVFDRVDVLIMPTAPGLPERIDNAQNPDTPSGAEPSVRNTAPFNVFGLPALSVPCGFSGSGLPIGLQLVGAPFADGQVLALGHAYELATRWTSRQPPAAV